MRMIDWLAYGFAGLSACAVVLTLGVPRFPTRLASRLRAYEVFRSRMRAAREAAHEERRQMISDQDAAWDLMDGASRVGPIDVAAMNSPQNIEFLRKQGA